MLFLFKNPVSWKSLLKLKIIGKKNEKGKNKKINIEQQNTIGKIKFLFTNNLFEQLLYVFYLSIQM